MHIRLAYGKTGLEIDLPDHMDVTVVEPSFVAGLPDPSSALCEALRQPIGSSALVDSARPGGRIGIVFSDITRPVPHRQILHAVLQELRAVPGLDITLFNALGTHRPNTQAELRTMIGDDLVDGLRIVQNDAFDTRTQVHCGATASGHEIWLNREFMECDLKILTGFIEPHMFAGFSGGGKAIMPGMAGQTTVLGNHDAAMLSSPAATWGVTAGNPVWEEVHEVALAAGPTFLVNVALNRDKEITGIFAGELVAAHASGSDFVKRTAMAPVDSPFDVVVTSNSGYPLDLNLYQSVKGMSAAAQVVKQGGAILVAAECWDGIPDHGLYSQLLRQAESPLALMEMIKAPGFLEQDQWQVQIQAQVQLKADVFVYSGNLTRAQIESALLRYSERIESTIAELYRTYGPGARICVLPEGPQTIPYVSARASPAQAAP